MVSTSHRQYWKPSSHFPVSIVNIDALHRCTVQGLKEGCEDEAVCGGINLPLQVVCRGPCKFGGNWQYCKKENYKSSWSITLGCWKTFESQIDSACFLVTRPVAQMGLIRRPNDWDNSCTRRKPLL